MKSNCARPSSAALVASLKPHIRALLMTCWNVSQWKWAAEAWPIWARPEQLPPPSDWRTWVFMGGRGAGKTRAGAEWVAALALSGAAGRIALVAPTFHDVR